MLAPVIAAVEGLRKAFPDAVLDVIEDGSGGAYFIVETVDLGRNFTPAVTWMGAQIPPQYPYADIYPLFMGADVRFTNGVAFVAPITMGHTFRQRPAIQISRRTNRLDPALQTAASKLQKVIYWLQQQ